MPIFIIIAMLAALFTLGANMHPQKGNPAQVVIVGGKQYYQVEKKDNRNTLVLMASAQNENSITIQAQPEDLPIENIIEYAGLYNVLKFEPMPAVNNSINSNMKQAFGLTVKE